LGDGGLGATRPQTGHRDSEGEVFEIVSYRFDDVRYLHGRGLLWVFG
jgi:hypothetical protein